MGPFAWSSFGLMASIGFLLGMRHATDADHVIAVSTIVSKERGLLKAGLIGALWGVGHTFTIFVVGIAILNRMIAIPTTKMVKVCPTPQSAPISPAFSKPRSLLTIVETGNHMIGVGSVPNTNQKHHRGHLAKRTQGTLPHSASIFFISLAETTATQPKQNATLHRQKKNRHWPEQLSGVAFIPNIAHTPSGLSPCVRVRDQARGCDDHKSSGQYGKRARAKIWSRSVARSTAAYAASAGLMRSPLLGRDGRLRVPRLHCAPSPRQ